MQAANVESHSALDLLTAIGDALGFEIDAGLIREPDKLHWSTIVKSRLTTRAWIVSLELEPVDIRRPGPVPPGYLTEPA